MIYDHMNRQYQLNGCDASYTYLVCVKSGDKIKIANDMFGLCGFSCMPEKILINYA